MQVKQYHPPFWVRVLSRPFLRIVLGLLFRILARIKITGKENVPMGKPYIVAINHVSLFDPPFTGVFWPEQLEAMGAVDIWSRPGQGILARMWGGIQVHRGEYDRAMLETVLSVLSSGYPLLIAPEGGRSHAPGLRVAKPGIAFLIEQSKVPVIPVGIVGTTDDFMQNALKGKRPLLEMKIGKPILFPAAQPEGTGRRENRQRNADLVMQRIAELLPEDYRGVYASGDIPAKTQDPAYGNESMGEEQ
jgi:1-acyl-sn-glycerol-3-phosphate acyltransferase